MLSQKSNIKYIKDPPESLCRKLLSGDKPEKIDSIINGLREDLKKIYF